MSAATTSRLFLEFSRSKPIEQYWPRLRGSGSTASWIERAERRASEAPP